MTHVTTDGIERWEYKHIIGEEHITSDELNEFGALGWELCGFAVLISRPDTWVWNYIFKRPMHLTTLREIRGRWRAAEEQNEMRRQTTLAKGEGL